MAAEDYFDPYDEDRFNEPARYSRPRAQRKSQIIQPKKSGKVKNKDIEWTTGQGEIIAVGNMEDSHLSNTISYINRRMDEHNNALITMSERGFVIPPYTINKRTGDEWLNILGKEALRRYNKEIEKAKQTLGCTNKDTLNSETV